MWYTVITKEFIEKFGQFDNVKADVLIQHALYGNQNANGILIHTLLDEGRVGIVVDGEEKYIYMDELCDAYIKERECCIMSDVMKMSLRL